MPKTALPALHSNDRRTGLDDIQLKRILQAKPNTIVHLKGKQKNKKIAQSRFKAAKKWVTDILLPLALWNTSGFGVPERVASPVQVDLARSLFVASHCK